MSSDLISRQDAIEAIEKNAYRHTYLDQIIDIISELPPAQPGRLTDHDFETIRIHLNAYKESLCCQRRFEEAKEYQRIIDRFMAFATAQQWIENGKDVRKGENRCTKVQ